MKIDSIQAPSIVNQNSNSKGMPDELGFFDVLSQTLVVENEDLGKTPYVNIERSKEVDETDIDTVNLLPMFMVLSTYENKDQSLSILNEGDLIKDVVLIDEVVLNSDIELSMTESKMIENKADVLITATDLPSKDESLIQIANVVISKEEHTPIKLGTIPQISIKEDSVSKEKIIAPEMILRGYVEDKQTVEKEIVGIEVKSKDGLVTKNKDTNSQENQLININVKTLEGTNFNSKVNSVDPEVFKENIQAVNDSIIELVETTTVGDSSVMKVRLYPKELGDVNITLKMEEGKLIAKILVDSDYVKQLFTGKINELSESLIRQNIFIEKIEVDLNSNIDHNLNSNSNSSKGFNQNNKRNYNTNPNINFTKKLTSGIMRGNTDSGLGAISILA